MVHRSTLKSLLVFARRAERYELVKIGGPFAEVLAGCGVALSIFRGEETVVRVCLSVRPSVRVVLSHGTPTQPRVYSSPYACWRCKSKSGTLSSTLSTRSRRCSCGCNRHRSIPAVTILGRERTHSRSHPAAGWSAGGREGGHSTPRDHTWHRSPLS